ncbi:jg14729 [Pararge aegeria aegeria]|uniref:Jg14729 protein n=1 Tax=Pararge aegeria aegeria TaxID=348720 RepID=A0A8S4SF05_9NEOP|nr:jg14729 [Pararge aegeria aegeria]
MTLALHYIPLVTSYDSFGASKGKVESTRARGRSPIRWTDQIKSSVGGPLHEFTRLSANREKWRMIVRQVTTATNNIPPRRTRPLWQECYDIEERRAQVW